MEVAPDVLIVMLHRVLQLCFSVVLVGGMSTVTRTPLSYMCSGPMVFCFAYPFGRYQKAKQNVHEWALESMSSMPN
jgi:hypothetical protein